jgi:hypothetical protein
MDDNKNSAGLGELYEKDFVRAATGGAVEDKDDPLRQVCVCVCVCVRGGWEGFWRTGGSQRPWRRVGVLDSRFDLISSACCLMSECC